MTSSPTVGAITLERAGDLADLPDLMSMLARVPDPRARRGRRYPLAGLLAVAISAVVAGARSFAAIGEWAAALPAESLAMLGLDTAPETSNLRKLFARLDGAALDVQLAAYAWTKIHAIGGPSGVRRVVAIDGKTIRGARSGKASATTAPHLIAALDHATGVVLAQNAVAVKSNEIPAGRNLLAGFDPVDLHESVITVDAMHTQTDTATAITNAGGHYVFTVKANQCATRRFDVSPPQELERRFLGLMTYLEPKGEGDSSMSGNRWPGPGVRDGVPGDPHGMAKAGLLESQSPAAAIYCDWNGTCHRCPPRLGCDGSPWSTFVAGAMPSEGI